MTDPGGFAANPLIVGYVQKLGMISDQEMTEELHNLFAYELSYHGWPWPGDPLPACRFVRVYRVAMSMGDAGRPFRIKARLAIVELCRSFDPRESHPRLLFELVMTSSILNLRAAKAALAERRDCLKVEYRGWTAGAELEKFRQQVAASHEQGITPSTGG